MCLMLSQRTSSQTASRDCCCCGCLTKIRLLGRNQGKCLLLLVRSTGQDEHSKKVLEAGGCLYYLHGPSGLEAVAYMHVDDFLVAFEKSLQEVQRCIAASFARAAFETTVGHGRVLSDHLRDGNHIKVTLAKSTMSLECMNIDLASRTLESPLTNAEITGY